MLGANTEIIATHLREIHYRLAIVCDLCKSFASMSVQSIFDQYSGFTAKCAKECAEQEGYERVKSLHKKRSKVWEQEKAS